MGKVTGAGCYKAGLFSGQKVMPGGGTPKDEKEQRFHHRGAEITEKKRGDFL